MFERIILPLALGTCLTFAVPAWAEGDSSGNPKPLADDVTLPPLCGDEMVFRHVYVLTEGALDDREVNLGYAFNKGEAGYQQLFISGCRHDYVSGQFSLADLAPAWQQKLSASLPKPAADTPLKPVLYFINKYEVATRRYAAMMSQATVLSDQGETPACDVPDGMAARLPRVDFSRFDAKRFGAVYSVWLLKNHPKLLPVSDRGKNPEDGGIDFVHLPTEVEWEFAARGGQAVSRQGLEDRLSSHRVKGSNQEGPLGNWATYSQVTGGTGRTARLLPMGMKRSSPLGLFDVTGNAAEMVQESFQLVHAGHRQGTYDGFVVKGGNYLRDEMTLFIGMHRECPLFAADSSEQRNETTGFRVAVGTLSAPRSHYPELFTQWQKEGRLAALTDTIDDAQDPTKQLDGVIATTRDLQIQVQLAQINEKLKRNVSLIARQREEAARDLIQSTTLIAETINNYSIRLANPKKDREKVVTARDRATAQFCTGAITNGRSALDGALATCIGSLATDTRYTDTVIQTQFQRTQEKLNRNPVLGKSLVRRTTLFVKHIGDYRQQHRAEPEAVLKELLASSGC